MPLLCSVHCSMVWARFQVESGGRRQQEKQTMAGFSTRPEPNLVCQWHAVVVCFRDVERRSFHATAECSMKVTFFFATGFNNTLH